MGNLFVSENLSPDFNFTQIAHDRHVYKFQLHNKLKLHWVDGKISNQGKPGAIQGRMFMFNI